MKTAKLAAYNTNSLAALGKSLAACIRTVEANKNKQLVIIMEAAKEHPPISAVSMAMKEKQTFKADMIHGMGTLDLPEATIKQYASNFFRALVYASNGIALDYVGSVNDYNAHCADSATTASEAAKVYKPQDHSASAKNKAAKDKKPSTVKALTRDEMYAEILRMCQMLGRGKDGEQFIAFLKSDAIAPDVKQQVKIKKAA